MDKRFTFEELQAIVATLRSEHGCPWDKAQTHESIKPTTLEEAYEVNQAVSYAVSVAGPDDVVVVAGRGHQNYQMINGKVVPFPSDEELLLSACRGDE